MTSRSFMRPVDTFYKKYILDCMYSPFTKITYITVIPPYLFGTVASELSEVLSPRLQSSYCPK